MIDLPAISIQPGELSLVRRPTILRTILGSCVGVTFWCPALDAGALCHGVLPFCPSGVAGPDGYKYVDYAIRYLTRQFLVLGAGCENIEVKVFGGADVLPVDLTIGGKQTVGTQNCKAALKVLEELGLMVSASDLGGSRGRTLHFDTVTGEVLIHRHAILRDSGPEEPAGLAFRRIRG